MNIAELWWKRISNTSRLIEDIADKLNLGKSVIVNFENSIPWADTFKELIESRLREHGTQRGFDIKSVSKDQNPGEFIFEAYCHPNDKPNYWMTETYEAFMARENENSVLKEKYVCIEGICSYNASRWLRSIDEYLSCFNDSDNHGIFLLLNHGNIPNAPASVSSFNYDNYISDYDSLMLCLTIVSELKCSSKEKQYIAEAANILSNGSYEIAGQLAEKGFELIEDPCRTAANIFRKNKISYTDLSNQVNSALWEAQTKIVFPIVEAYRKYFSEKYSDKIAEHLPFNDNMTSQKIYNVNELEVGHLLYLSERFKFAEKRDHDKLTVIKEARDNASHWNVIDLERFRELIKE